MMWKAEEIKRFALKKYTFLWILTFMLFGGYVPLEVLQSSINIEEGKGVWSLMATYVGGSLFNLLFVPTLLRTYGVRKTMYMAQTTYLIYSIANFYPQAFILIPAGLIVGIGEACFWPSAILFTIHYASCYSVAGTTYTTAGQYTTQFLGFLFSALSLSGVFGNILTWAILYSGDAHKIPRNESEVDLTVCGTADCQDPEVTEANIEQYELGSPAVFYGTIGGLSGLILISILITLLTIPEVDKSKENLGEEEEENEEKEDLIIMETKDGVKPTKNPDDMSLCEGIMYSLRHLISTKQILLTPYALYSGAHLAFFLSEETRSYVACLRGVTEVGLFVLVGSVSMFIASPIVGWVSARCGRNIAMLFGYVLDVGKYILLLLWTPSHDDTWMVYLFAVAEGVVDGVLQLSAQDIHGIFFPKRRETALSAMNMYNTLGRGIIYAISTSFCMYVKLYVMIALATVAIIGYAIVEFCYKHDIEHVEMSEVDSNDSKSEDKA